MQGTELVELLPSEVQILVNIVLFIVGSSAVIYGYLRRPKHHITETDMVVTAGAFADRETLKTLVLACQHIGVQLERLNDLTEKRMLEAEIERRLKEAGPRRR